MAASAARSDRLDSEEVMWIIPKKGSYGLTLFFKLAPKGEYITSESTFRSMVWYFLAGGGSTRVFVEVATGRSFLVREKVFERLVEDLEILKELCCAEPGPKPEPERLGIEDGEVPDVSGALV